MSIKKLEILRSEAYNDYERWNGIHLSRNWSDVGKTEKQAFALSQYFEGKLDGLNEALKLIK